MKRIIHWAGAGRPAKTAGRASLNFSSGKIERDTGIEPVYSAWEADTLPLC